MKENSMNSVNRLSFGSIKGYLANSNGVKYKGGDINLPEKNAVLKITNPLNRLRATYSRDVVSIDGGETLGSQIILEKVDGKSEVYVTDYCECGVTVNELAGKAKIHANEKSRAHIKKVTGENTTIDVRDGYSTADQGYVTIDGYAKVKLQSNNIYPRGTNDSLPILEGENLSIH